MNERQASILSAIIEHYIRTGQPVGSAWLVSEGEFDISPATIRNEMSELDDAGYLAQPHTSAGRIPTEDAFHYYLAHFLDVEEPALRERRVVSQALKNRGSSSVSMRELARRLAEVSEEAALVSREDGEVYVSGIAQLFRQPEFQDYELRLEIASTIDACEDVARVLFQSVEDEIAVLIGSKNPFGPEYGAVVTKLPVGSDGTMLGIVGPMRMDYNAHVGLLQFLYRTLLKREAEVRIR